MVLIPFQLGLPCFIQYQFPSRCEWLTIDYQTIRRTWSLCVILPCLRGTTVKLKFMQQRATQNGCAPLADVRYVQYVGVELVTCIQQIYQSLVHLRTNHFANQSQQKSQQFSKIYLPAFSNKIMTQAYTLSLLFLENAVINPMVVHKWSNVLIIHSCTVILGKEEVRQHIDIPGMQKDTVRLRVRWTWIYICIKPKSDSDCMLTFQMSQIILLK